MKITIKKSEAALVLNDKGLVKLLLPETKDDAPVGDQLVTLTLIAAMIKVEDKDFLKLMQKKYVEYFVEKVKKRKK